MQVETIYKLMKLISYISLTFWDWLSTHKFSIMFRRVFNKTIIPLALVGYEMIIANSALRASLAIYHLISNARSWNNC